ncbi:uncharacterized protein CYBJADRAFT_49499 [Cyberlindnera jadinii NRRL Y-1542]|uniref:Uncharacterized protein n=1 Tax=Cyberlindnera jadinii (strain ATCC 18201 / CBS 1600 / BCRC 20928 / JCM 3617 / NBRC 0987 / NRRL Y-1542) TaxID=983966 RepID=A0A1E4S7U7_CYBJN|nr:hypothetical protein CYBJADRAFT_49499 [Cyberlindnera jadinii NRRL Y-1542]ODV75548.1 hypothetical protein CYBJADRAFT_49499 [Cyberlindnera jadinii NRRL Y-1542]
MSNLNDAIIPLKLQLLLSLLLLYAETWVIGEVNLPLSLNSKYGPRDARIESSNIHQLHNVVLTRTAETKKKVP